MSKVIKMVLPEINLNIQTQDNKLIKNAKRSVIHQKLVLMRKISSSVLKNFSEKIVNNNHKEYGNNKDQTLTLKKMCNSSVFRSKKNLFNKSSSNLLARNYESNKTSFQKKKKINSLGRVKNRKKLDELELRVENNFPYEKKVLDNCFSTNNINTNLNIKLRTFQTQKANCSNEMDKIQSTLNLNSLSDTNKSVNIGSYNPLRKKPAVKGSKFINNFSVLNYSQMEKLSTERNRDKITEIIKPYEQKKEIIRDLNTAGEGDQNIIITKINYFRKLKILKIEL